MGLGEMGLGEVGLGETGGHQLGLSNVFFEFALIKF
jgi:hypothetical protein